MGRGWIRSGHGVHCSHSKIILKVMRDYWRALSRRITLTFCFLKITLATVQACLYERLEWKPGDQ